MKLSINRRIMRPGDVLEISWDSTGWSQQQELVVCTGNKTTTLPIPPTGTKKLRMKGGSVINWIGLRTSEYNKNQMARRYFLIFGSKNKTDEFEYIDNQPYKQRINHFKDQLRARWNMHSHEQQRLIIILGMLLIYQLLMGIYPSLAHLMLLGTIFYIFWQITHRQ